MWTTPLPPPDPGFYLGEGPEVEFPASTCEVCEEVATPALVAPCPTGDGFVFHRHVTCPVCWRAAFALAIKHGGQGAICWLN